MSCQDLHIFTSTEHLDVSRQQTLRPSPCRPVPQVQLSLGRRVCVPSHLLWPAVLSTTKAASTGAHRHSDKADQTTAPTKPLRSFLSHKSSFVCSVPASKLTSVTIHTKKTWEKSFNLEYFPLSHVFWPTTGLYFQFPLPSSQILFWQTHMAHSTTQMGVMT